MAYDPSVYNPYGQQQFTPIASVNGLVSIDSIESGYAYPMPPNSVSPALFLKDEDAFIVKRTDGSGNGTIKKYTFKEEPISQADGSDFVTRDYLDSKIEKLMEAINGKHTLPGQHPAEQPGAQPTAPDPVTGPVQHAVQPNVQ